MMLKSHIAPAHPHPIPSILANSQLAYTAISVANCKHNLTAITEGERSMLEQMKRAAMFSTSEKRVEGEAYELSSDEGADEQEARALDEGPAA